MAVVTNLLKFQMLLLILPALVSCVDSSQQSGSKSRISIDLPNFKNSSQKLLSVSSSTIPGWGLSNITAAQDIDCYALFVQAADLSGNTCKDEDNITVLEPGEMFGLQAAGDSLSISIEAGPQRKLSLLGFRKSDSANCEDFKSSAFNRNNYSAPVVISEVTHDLIVGDNQIEMSLNFNTAKTLQYCTGPGFSNAWNVHGPTNSPVSILNSLVTASSSIVPSGQSLTVTVTANDLNGNILTSGGHTVALGLSGGTSTGTFSAVTDNSNGTYSSTFTAANAGTPVTISATINGLSLISLLPTIQVTTAAIAVLPPALLAISGDSTLPADDCSSPFTLTVKDSNGVTVNATSSLTVTLSGNSLGSFYSDAACTSVISSLTVSSGTNSAQFFYKNSAVESLALVAATSGLASAVHAISIAPSIAWSSPDVGFQWESPGGFSAGGKGDGMMLGPSGVHKDPSNGDLYVADTMNGRVIKYNSSGTFIGWIGAVGETPTGGASGCTSLSSGQFTPGWCLGGRSLKSSMSVQANGGLNAPIAVLSDSAYLYVGDYATARINRYDKSTGSFQGWIGRIGATPASSGASGCTTANQVAPGWCWGGVSFSGTTDGAFSSSLREMTISGSYLYVVDSTPNHRIQRFNVSSGAYAGWIGKIATSPNGGDSGCNGAAANSYTPGWCTGGTSVGGTVPGHFATPFGITSDGTYLFVSNSTGVRIEKFVASTGVFMGWIGQVLSNPSGGDAGCTSSGGGTFTPGWCLGGASTVGGVNPLNGGMALVTSIKSDSNYLYALDATRNIIRKYNKTTGAFIGWSGRIATTPSGGASGCTSATSGSTTPGWCTGGSAKVGSGNGSFTFNSTGQVFSLMDYDYYSGHLYISDSYNNRIVKMDANTGSTNSWIGAKATSNFRWRRYLDSDFLSFSYDGNLLSGLNFPTSADQLSHSMTLLNNNLYIADSKSNSIKKFDLITGAMLGWRGVVDLVPTGGPAVCNTYTAGSFNQSWCSGGTSTYVSTTAGAHYQPSGTVTDGTYMYTSESLGNRIQRFSLANGTDQGWIGKINSAPSAGDAGCAGLGAGNVTPGWCIGGSASNGTADGNLSTPKGLAIAGGFLFVVDGNNHRIVRYNLSTGVFAGWTGKISTAPTGGAAGCAGASVGTATPGWCTGGTSGTATITGGFSTPTTITTDGSYLYVGEESAAYARVSKIDVTTGATVGWIGKTSAAISGGIAGCTTVNANAQTPGWCVGGTPTGSSVFNLPEGAFSQPKGILYHNGYLYVSDGSSTVKHVIQKYDATTGAYIGWKGMIASTPYGGDAGCAGAAVGTFTPGWCIGGLPKQVSGTNLGFDSPSGLAADSNYLYVYDTGRSRIIRIPH